MEELKEAIKNTDNKKQQEPDKIFLAVIKNLGPKAIDTLYKKLWTSNMILPADWTKALIIPILKSGKQQKK
jgi:hypothetical protein